MNEKIEETEVEEVKIMMKMRWGREMRYH